MLHRTYSRRSLFRMLALGGGVAVLTGATAIRHSASASESSVVSKTELKPARRQGAHLSQSEWAKLD